MRPILVALFGVELPAYFAMLATGFALATLIGARWVGRLGHDRGRGYRFVHDNEQMQQRFFPQPGKSCRIGTDATANQSLDQAVPFDPYIGDETCKRLLRNAERRKTHRAGDHACFLIDQGEEMARLAET